MGHCNNVALASLSPVEQAVKIEQCLRAVLQPAGPGEEKTQAAASANLNVNIQAGVSIMGSKNVVAFSGKEDGSKDGTKGDEEPLAGRKRRAESVSLSSCSQCPVNADTNLEGTGACGYADGVGKKAQGGSSAWGIGAFDALFG